jgi:hypothetical protein
MDDSLSPVPLYPGITVKARTTRLKKVKWTMDSYQNIQNYQPWASDETPASESLESWESDDESESDDEDVVEESSERPFSIRLWLQVLWQHPLIFWSGIWAIIFLIAGIAFAGLMSPYLSSQAPEPTPTRSSQPTSRTTVADRESDRLPIWSVVAIAASCAAGSMLISQRMKYQRSYRSLKTVRQRPAWAEGDRSQAHPLILPQATPISASPEVPALQLGQPTLKPAMPISYVQPSYARPSFRTVTAPTPEEPIVTIVPADESTPLDWQEDSLADLMDIRYRRRFG